MREQARRFSIASFFGVLGFFLSVVSLIWQVHVYKEGFVERALVRFGISFQLQERDFPLMENDDPYSWLRKKQGDLTVEVVNIGQHPLYVKRVYLRVPCTWAEGSESEGIELCDFELAKGFKPSEPIEPGAAALYKGGIWDFSHHALDFGEPAEPYCVVVESNKGLVAQSSELLIAVDGFLRTEKEEASPVIVLLRSPFVRNGTTATNRLKPGVQILDNKGSLSSVNYDSPDESGESSEMRKLERMLLLLLMGLLLTDSLGRQMKHAPTVEQCRADQRSWLDKVEHSEALPDYKTLNAWCREMQECKSVDPENQRRYYNLCSEIASEEVIRLEKFLDRHGLYDKFIEEDKAGKR